MMFSDSDVIHEGPPLPYQLVPPSSIKFWGVGRREGGANSLIISFLLDFRGGSFRWDLGGEPLKLQSWQVFICGVFNAYTSDTTFMLRER